jgi:carbonic anhydrase
MFGASIHGSGGSGVRNADLGRTAVPTGSCRGWNREARYRGRSDDHNGVRAARARRLERVAGARPWGFADTGLAGNRRTARSAAVLTSPPGIADTPLLVGEAIARREGTTVMSLIEDALTANAIIADDYDPGPGRGKPPAPKIAIVTCADPRLSGIVRMLGLADADVDMIRNVGSVIDDDSVRSLVISTRVLGTKEIMIINHTDCGMLRFTDGELEDRLHDETGMWPIAPARFYSFTETEQNTREQVQRARSHPWISADVPVRGFVYDLDSGRLSEVLPTGAALAGRP